MRIAMGQNEQKPTFPLRAGLFFGASWPLATGPERRSRLKRPATHIPWAISQDWYPIALKPEQASAFMEAAYPI